MYIFLDVIKFNDTIITNYKYLLIIKYGIKLN